MALQIWPPEMVERTAKGEPRVMDQWRYNLPGGDTAGTLSISVNAIGDLRDLYVAGEKGGKFYRLPEPSRHAAGCPLIGGFLVVTPPGKPPLFTPITQGRAQVQTLTHDVHFVAPWKPRGGRAPRVDGKTRAVSAWVY